VPLTVPGAGGSFIVVLSTHGRLAPQTQHGLLILSFRGTRFYMKWRARLYLPLTDEWQAEDHIT